MAGRYTKFTPKVAEKIITALSVGMTDVDACVVAGISDETLRRWRKLDVDFMERSTRAREEGWQGALAVIKHAAVKDRDWRAAGDFLDRTKSAYRKSNETQITGADGGAVQIVGIGIPKPPGIDT